MNVRQIKIGKHQTGIIGLDDLLKEMAKNDLECSDSDIGTQMVNRLGIKNYIPSNAVDQYKAAFIREYKKFKGEPVEEIPTDGIEIKVLGAGCPNCDRLEQTLMGLIQELGIQADLEHIRDMQQISQYGVMGSPALVINGKVKAVGSVPSISKLKDFIMEAANSMK